MTYNTYCTRPHTILHTIPYYYSDPINIELIRQKEDKRRQNDLSELAQQQKTSQTQILQQLQIKWNFQLQEFHLRIEQLQEKMEARQRKQRDDLESLQGTERERGGRDDFFKR